MITGNGLYNSSIQKPDLRKKKKMEDFPGGPVVKTLCSHCSRGRFDPGLGSHMSCDMSSLSLYIYIYGLTRMNRGQLLTLLPFWTIMRFSYIKSSCSVLTFSIQSTVEQLSNLIDRFRNSHLYI